MKLQTGAVHWLVRAQLTLEDWIFIQMKFLQVPCEVTAEAALVIAEAAAEVLQPAMNSVNMGPQLG